MITIFSILWAFIFQTQKQEQCNHLAQLKMLRGNIEVTTKLDLVWDTHKLEDNNPCLREEKENYPCDQPHMTFKISVSMRRRRMTTTVGYHLTSVTGEQSLRMWDTLTQLMHMLGSPNKRLAFFVLPTESLGNSLVRISLDLHVWSFQLSSHRYTNCRHNSSLLCVLCPKPQKKKSTSEMRSVSWCFILDST